MNNTTCRLANAFHFALATFGSRNPQVGSLAPHAASEALQVFIQGRLEQAPVRYRSSVLGPAAACVRVAEPLSPAKAKGAEFTLLQIGRDMAHLKDGTGQPLVSPRNLANI